MKIHASHIFTACVVLAASMTFASPFLMIGIWYLTEA